MEVQYAEITVEADFECHIENKYYSPIFVYQVL